MLISVLKLFFSQYFLFLNCRLPFTSAAQIQRHSRLLVSLEANTTSSDKTARSGFDYQSTSADERADDICREWLEKG